MQPAMRIEKPGTMMMQISAELAKASELAVRRRKVSGSLQLICQSIWTQLCEGDTLTGHRLG
jgi:hypothetical protein